MSVRAGPPQVGIIVFEKRPYWGPELKRQVSGREIIVRECRSLHNLRPAASELRNSVTVVVLEPVPADCLSWLARQIVVPRHSEIVVIASRDLARLEWPIREAGVTEFINDEIPGVQLARICLRILRKAGSEAGRVAASPGQ